MKSINLIPPKRPQRQLRPWIAMLLILTLAAGVVAGIYYYVDNIHRESQQYWAEARAVEQQTADFLARAVPRTRSDQLKELIALAEGIVASRIEWESHLLAVMQPLPPSTIIHSLSSEGAGQIHVTLEFDAYNAAVSYIEQLEQLPEASSVNVMSFDERLTDKSETVPVVGEDGAILYYETRNAHQTRYSVTLRIALSEGGGNP